MPTLTAGTGDAARRPRPRGAAGVARRPRARAARPAGARHRQPPTRCCGAATRWCRSRAASGVGASGGAGRCTSSSPTTPDTPCTARVFDRRWLHRAGRRGLPATARRLEPALAVPGVGDPGDRADGRPARAAPRGPHRRPRRSRPPPAGTRGSGGASTSAAALDVGVDAARWYPRGSDGLPLGRVEPPPAERPVGRLLHRHHLAGHAHLAGRARGDADLHLRPRRPLRPAAPRHLRRAPVRPARRAQPRPRARSSAATTPSSRRPSLTWRDWPVTAVPSPWSMQQVGTVTQLWRYPVKSFQGEQVESPRARAGRRRGRPHARRRRPGGREGPVGQALRRPPHGLGPADGTTTSCSRCPTGASTRPTTPACTTRCRPGSTCEVRLEAPPADGVFPMEMYTGMSDDDHPAVRLARPAGHLARPGRRALADHAPAWRPPPTLHPDGAVGRPPLPAHRPHRHRRSRAGSRTPGRTIERRRRGLRRPHAHAALHDAVPGPARARRDKTIGTTIRDHHDNNLGVYASIARAGSVRWAIACTPASTPLATVALAAAVHWVDRWVNRPKGLSDHAQRRPSPHRAPGLSGQAPRGRPGRLHPPPGQGARRPRPPRRGARRPALPDPRRRGCRWSSCPASTSTTTTSRCGCRACGS